MTAGPPAPRYRDAHTHLSAGAVDLSDLDLRGKAAAEIASAIAGAASGRAARSWIRGWGWSGGEPPRDAAPDHPVWIARSDGHAAWLSSAARAALGVPADVRVIEEELFDTLRRMLPEPSASERRAAIIPRLHELRDLGVGAVDDMVEPWGPEIYTSLLDRGELPIHVGLWLPESIEESDAQALRGKGDTPLFHPNAVQFGRKRGVSPFLPLRGIKIFLDGSLSARTAALSLEYADDPGNEGALRMEPREIADRVGRWTRRGWPVAIHAIGDRAVSLALDALEEAPRPAWGAHRVEHAQVVRRSDLPRFARAGIVASVQPGHWRDDRRFLSTRLGDRADVVVHPLRSLAQAGATLELGSDWPVSSWSPGFVLDAATDPERGEEALDAAAAAAWYTFRPA